MQAANDFLGSCCYHGTANEQLNSEIDSLHEDMFSDATQRDIFSAIRRLKKRNSVVDLNSIFDEADCELSYIAGIARDVVNVDRFDEYSRVIRDHYATATVKRDIEELGKTLNPAAPGSAFLIRQKIEKILTRLNFKTGDQGSTQLTFGSEKFDHSVEWLIKGVIPAECFGIMFGPSGSYKSFCMIDMFCSLSSGIDWHGNKVRNIGATVYIAAEGGLGVRRRIKAWELKHGVTINNLALVAEPIIINDDGVLRIMKIIADVEAKTGQKVTAIAIDTLARCYEGNENDNSEMNGFVQACDRIKIACKCTVMVVHHSGKDASKGARGASSLKGANDFEYRVTRPKDSKLKFQLDCTKQKDAEEMSTVEFLLKSFDLGVVDADGDRMFSLAVDSVSLDPMTDAYNDLLEQQTDTPGSRNKNVKRQIELIIQNKHNDGLFNYPLIRDEFYHQNPDVDKAKLRKSLSASMRKLEEDNVIQKVGHDSGGQRYIYLRSKPDSGTFDQSGF